MSLSRDSLLVLDELLGQVQLSVSHPDFELAAARLSRAKRELAAALAETDAEANAPIASPREEPQDA